jgi:hypothetical protein
MDVSSFSKERDAYEALTALMVHAQKVRELFAVAGLSTPEPLLRLLGGAQADGINKDRGRPTISFNIPVPGERPQEATDEWIWIPLKDLSPTGLLLAVLRSHTGYMPSKAAVEAISAIRKGLNPGSIFNIAARLSGTLIERSSDGWMLKPGAISPVLCGEYAWGPEGAFGKYELAAHRRLLIRHLLIANDAGLQIVQIMSQLINSGLCHAPVTKELVKADLEAMQKEGRARRRGNSKKWELIEHTESNA